MKQKLFPLFFVVAAVALSGCAPKAGGAFADVNEVWCLDSQSEEIYTVRANGARETLVVEEAVVMDGKTIAADDVVAWLMHLHQVALDGKATDAADTQRVFDEGLAEAIDGADALDTSMVADAWEAVIESIYGHDAFGQRVEIIGGITTRGHRCRIVKAPGLSSMVSAFRNRE